ncbi:substrate-binding domain-containing protein [Kaistia dalseonensis]|uniref:Ribose transport system substrate-binding protein n=1 Tax=Kaistia dalseonensis TaxID=410840 RepID=A0ABU0H418_9HYPH|nr:substrate-binding domain-containing protein [Kaistia dalseonensis]MCX5494469.1 substrate-binding domain-containing protein [Kaistia dalseonensis]MDQ0437048.1 ribose transport system substrate-binding protein [Kaistia dalseonensis]
MEKAELNRRGLLAAIAAAGVGAAVPLAAGSATAAAAEASDAEYVFLSIVTQVPFWVDHRAGLDAAAADLGVKTTFTGPLDFDTAGQARQLDELIARRPAGLLIFPGDAAALAPGIDRAIEAGIPVACIIGDVPESKRTAFLGISNYDAGRVGGEMLAEAVGGKGKVLLGTFPAPSTLDRVRGYKDVFAEKYPEIEVVDVVNDKADPSYAPTAYSQALQAHPDVVGIGGTDGDSGKGAALAVVELGKVGAVKIVAMDRNSDMLPYIADGTIDGAVAQKSWLESYLAVHLLHWLHENKIQIVKDSAKAGINPLPDTVSTGVMRVTKANVAEFMSA